MHQMVHSKRMHFVMCKLELYKVDFKIYLALITMLN